MFTSYHSVKFIRYKILAIALARKVEEYALLNIPEYWIVDFRGLGGLQFIGKPKQPTFTVCELVDSVYEQQQYRLGDAIASPLFPDLNLRLDDLMPDSLQQ